MGIYTEILKTSINSGVLAIFAAITSVALLISSQLIRSGEGEYHLGGINYNFSNIHYKGAFLMAGIYSLFALYFFPIIVGGGPIIHWLPMLIISLLSVQSIIDLKYHELANEWSFLIGILSIYWVYQNGQFGYLNVLISLTLFSLMVVSWLFTGLPGLGDAKLILVGSLFLDSWSSAYAFMIFIIILSLGTVMFDAIINKVPPKKWLKIRFPMGPYIAIAIISSMVGAI